MITEAIEAMSLQEMDLTSQLVYSMTASVEKQAFFISCSNGEKVKIDINSLHIEPNGETGHTTIVAGTHKQFFERYLIMHGAKNSTVVQSLMQALLDLYFKRTQQIVCVVEQLSAMEQHLIKCLNGDICYDKFKSNGCTGIFMLSTHEMEKIPLRKFAS